MHRVGVSRAKALRRRMTDAERRFWHAVRDRRLGGYKFKRQVPIGRWIADFACLDAALVVEIDGGQHSESKRDVIRDRDLEVRGFLVVRYWNLEVLKNLAGVIDGLLITLETRTAVTAPVTMFPSPRGGEGSDP
ncbi:MAG: endonuclease domain-containing protein [Bauldia sp.]|nr:endonuclease domain-containing protein [Bauldia sp.]